MKLIYKLILCLFIAPIMVNSSMANDKVKCNEVATLYDRTYCESEIIQGKNTSKEQKKDNLRTLMWNDYITRLFGKEIFEIKDNEINEFVNSFYKIQKINHKWDKKKLRVIKSILSSGEVSEEKIKELKQLEILVSMKIDKYKEDQDIQSKSPKFVKDMIETNIRMAGQSIIGSWNVNKSLYNLYGGIAIHKNNNIIPIEAYSKALDNIEKEGKLSFENKYYKDVFKDMKKFANEEHKNIITDNDKVIEFYSVPYWLRDSKEADAKLEEETRMIYLDNNIEYR